MGSGSGRNQWGAPRVAPPWDSAMPIRPYLQGQAFDPDTIRVMGHAFENVCNQLRIIDRHDAVTKIVARTVIDMAQRGFRDVDGLTSAVMEEFNPGPGRQDDPAT